jgi:ACS family glucarate transporter-like MFS transporter
LTKRRQILLLLVALAMITFLDRIAIASAGPRIQQALHLSADQWGWVLGAFILAYGLFEIPTGAMGDRRGPKSVLTRIVIWWSAFTALTGAAFSFGPLVTIRFLFGAGEAGAYPNMAAVTARWFPVKERAQAQGFIWGASRLGGALAPLLVVPLQRWIGWRQTFVVFGAVGLLWAVAWRAWYPTAGEPSANFHYAAARYGRLLRVKQLWLIIVMYFCYAWGSWFFFGWFPVWLVKGAGFSESEMAVFSALPFILGAAGNVAGGFLSDRMVAAYGVKTARRVVGSGALTGSALLLLLMSLTHNHAAIGVFSSLGFGVADLMLPAAWALCLDIGGDHAGLVTGMMNSAGQFGGFVCSVLFGYVVQATGSYETPLRGVAAMVLIAALLFTRIDASRPLIEPSYEATHSA